MTPHDDLALHNSKGHVWWCAILLYGGLAMLLGLGALTVVENHDKEHALTEIEWPRAGEGK